MTLTRSKEQPQSPILTDFVASLPQSLRCSDDFLAHGCHFRHKSAALNCKYIQFNELNCVSYLVFDIDKGWPSADIWIRFNLPEPNFVVQNPANGNCHYFYKLKTPVYLKKSEDSKVSEKAENYFNAIRTAMTAALKADPGFSHTLCKNPLSKQWRTLEFHSYAYELSELAGSVTLTSLVSILKAKTAKNDEAYLASGRNCTLFEDLRREAYAMKADYQDFDSFHSAVAAAAYKINRDFQPPLPVNEVKHTVKSVSTWTWNKYTGSGETCQRGAMGFSETRRSNPDLDKLSDEEIKARQRASALRSSAIKRKTTEAKITAGIAELIKNNQAVNHSSVAKQAQLNRNTIMAFAKSVGGCLFRWYQVVRGFGAGKGGHTDTFKNSYRVFRILNSLKEKGFLFFPVFAAEKRPLPTFFMPKLSEKMQI